MSGNLQTVEQQPFNRWLIALLESHDIAYAVGGSVAAMAYSEPRYTIDVDLMVALSLPDLEALIGEIERQGLYVDPFETVLEFNLPAVLPISIVDARHGMKADVYVARSTGLDVSAMQRRQRRVLYASPELEAWFLSPEDVILYKLDYFRQSDGHSTKHPADIGKMLAVSGRKLDLAYMTAWATKLGVLPMWQALWSEFDARSKQ